MLSCTQVARLAPVLGTLTATTQSNSFFERSLATSTNTSVSLATLDGALAQRQHSTCTSPRPVQQHRPNAQTTSLKRQKRTLVDNNKVSSYLQMQMQMQIRIHDWARPQRVELRDANSQLYAQNLFAHTRQSSSCKTCRRVEQRSYSSRSPTTQESAAMADQTNVALTCFDSLPRDLVS